MKSFTTISLLVWSCGAIGGGDAKWYLGIICEEDGELYCQYDDGDQDYGVDLIERPFRLHVDQHCAHSIQILPLTKRTDEDEEDEDELEEDQVVQTGVNDFVMVKDGDNDGVEEEEGEDVLEVIEVYEDEDEGEDELEVIEVDEDEDEDEENEEGEENKAIEQEFFAGQEKFHNFFSQKFSEVPEFAPGLISALKAVHRKKIITKKRPVEIARIIKTRLKADGLPTICQQIHDRKLSAADIVKKVVDCRLEEPEQTRQREEATKKHSLSITRVEDTSNELVCYCGTMVPKNQLELRD